MDSMGKVVRVSLLDFRKAYDLINHNKLLENFMNTGVRPSLIRWFATSYKGDAKCVRLETRGHNVRVQKQGSPKEVNWGLWHSSQRLTS